MGIESRINFRSSTAKSALAVMAMLMVAPLVGAHVGKSGIVGPVIEPQDCRYFDDNGDGAAFYHDYHGAGGNVITENNQGVCLPGDKKPHSDGAHFDGEWDFGFGVVFLNSKHHGGSVCIRDIILGGAAFVIASDTHDDGFLNEIQDEHVAVSQWDCDKITIPAGWGPPSKSPTKHCEYNDPENPMVDRCGLQRGWWVFIRQGAGGHVWTTICDAEALGGGPSAGCYDGPDPKDA